MNEISDMVRQQFDAKSIDFSTSCEVTHNVVACDRKSLSRVLMNLLNNAAKFTGENGTVSFKLKETSEADGQANFDFSVKDTGVGMDKDFVERLFIPFEREKTSTVSKIQGTGLGMAISKSIVDLMGGTIRVETEKGRGTEFTVSLTFPVNETAQVEAEKEAPKKELRFDGCRALLVEDNPINMEISEMLLTQAGFTVDRAENGKIALDMAAASAEGYYDIIVMDLQMPVMDGYESTRSIRALTGTYLTEVPIVAMSANAFDEDVKAALDAGMNGHIAKPLNIDVMMSTINSVLEKAAKSKH